MFSTPRRRHDIVVFTGTFEPGFKGGGPVRSIAHILDNLPPDLTCLVMTSDRDLGDTYPYPGLSGAVVERGRHEVHYIDRKSPGAWFRAFKLMRDAHPAVVYLNSYWSPAFTMLPTLVLALRVVRPRHLVVAPRGEFSQGALALKSKKKRVVNLLWSRALRLCRPVMEATTELEARDIARELPWARKHIRLQPNPGPDAVNGIPEPAAEAKFVFISRISPKKNLRTLLEAAAMMRHPVQIDVFGPREDPRYWQECASVIATLPPTTRVEYRGTMRPEDVQKTFTQYDLFAFPTHGENFGHVIAESLSAGCPVLCSDSTPWTPVLRGGGGEVVDTLDPSDWARALDAWAAKDASRRRADRAEALRAYNEWKQTVNNDVLVGQLVLEGAPG